jgi:Uma2 family endonuclease
MAAGIDTRPYIEIYDGEVRLKVPPSRLHSVVQPRLAEIFRRCAGNRGFVFTELHVRIGAVDGSDTLYLPDICYIAAERLGGEPFVDAVPRLAPDIAVEILSPGRGSAQRELKIARYLACSCALVLDVDPKEGSVVAHDRNGVRRFARSDVFHTAAFPWLRFEVAEAFADCERLERILGRRE